MSRFKGNKLEDSRNEPRIDFCRIAKLFQQQLSDDESLLIIFTGKREKLTIMEGSPVAIAASLNCEGLGLIEEEIHDLYSTFMTGTLAAMKANPEVETMFFDSWAFLNRNK